MRCFSGLWAAIAALTGAMLMGAGGAAPREPRRPPVYADPADVITAEIAFARLAREKGHWSADRATAAADAVMFVPQRVRAAEWLHGRRDPPVPARWQPHEVWMSCDGSFALADGTWQQGTDHGWFASIWQRQKRGGYKWVLQDGDRTKDADAASDTISAHVADCPKPADKAKIAVWNKPNAPGPDTTSERLTRANSADMTLHWETGDTPDGAHNLSVWMWKDGDMQQVHITEVSAPEPPTPPAPLASPAHP